MKILSLFMLFFPLDLTSVMALQIEVLMELLAEEWNPSDSGRRGKYYHCYPRSHHDQKGTTTHVTRVLFNPFKRRCCGDSNLVLALGSLRFCLHSFP